MTANKESMTDRVAPLVGPLANRRVLLLGAGSVGSRAAVELARAGVGAFHLIDPDTVALPNLARAEYCHGDIGQLKVEALAARLHAINPDLHVTWHASPLTDVPHEELTDLVISAHVVGGFSDDNAAQGHLAHHAYHAGVPLVTAGLYARAAAGEVVIVDSRRSPKPPCWFCTVGRGGPGERPPKDYGLGRLQAELALGPPIGVVTLTAVTAMLGLLAGPGRPAGEATGRLLEEGRTFCILGWRGFEVIDQIYPAPHMAGPLAAWIQPAASPSCSVCGPDAQAPPDPNAIASVMDDLISQTLAS